MRFSELGLAEPIARAVDAAGYETPTPIQAQAIPYVLDGRDLLGCAQTGTGKTAAFALPILHRLFQANSLPEGTSSAQPGAHAPASGTKSHSRGKRRPIRALVLSPTRELALQIHENVQTYRGKSGLTAAVVVGGVSQFQQVNALRDGVDILIATPGRLLDLVEQGYVRLSGVETIVLDEADHMLDLGFIPDVRRIFALVPKKRQTLLFSATMPGEIRQLANSLLKDPAQVTVAPVKVTTELIEQSVFHVGPGQKPQYLVHVLRNWPITRALVFTRTKRRADQVVRLLQKANLKAVAIHGDKSQAARLQALARFKSNHPPILVATDIAARGIDVDGVSHVLNYDLPHVSETYVHRIGRTGRAGASGVAVSLCDREERGLLLDIERLLKRKVPTQQEKPENLTASPEPAPSEEDSGSQPSEPAQQKPAFRGPRGGKPVARQNRRGPSPGSGPHPGKRKNRSRRRRPVTA